MYSKHSQNLIQASQQHLSDKNFKCLKISEHSVLDFENIRTELQIVSMEFCIQHKFTKYSIWKALKDLKINCIFEQIHATYGKILENKIICLRNIYEFLF